MNVALLTLTFAAAFVLPASALRGAPGPSDQVRSPGCAVPSPVAAAAIRHLIESEDERELRQIADSAGVDFDAALSALAAHRLYELTGEEARYSDALDILPRAESCRGTPWLDYITGRILLRSPDIGLRSLDWYPIKPVYRVVTTDRLERAQDLLRRAYDADPAFTFAVLDLAGFALGLSEQEALRSASATLDAALSDRPDVELYTAAAHVALALDDAPRALRLAELALEHSPGHAPAAYARALSFFAADNEQRATEAYFSAAAKLDDTAARRYLHDLLPILNPTEETAWTSLDNAGRAAWLRRFWQIRAALDALSVDERLAVHFSRLRTARTLFRRSAGSGAPPPGATREAVDRRLSFDDRGVFFVRWGQPDRVIRTQDELLDRNETWVYHQATDAPAVFTFALRDHYPDFYLTDALPECRGGRQQRRAVLTYYVDRGDVSPVFGPLAALCSAEAPDYQTLRFELAEAEAELRRVGLHGLAARHAKPHYAVPLEVFARTYTYADLTSDFDSTIANVAVLVPGVRLTPRPVDSGFVYAVELQFTVVDSLSGAVARRDTVVRVLSRQQLTDGEHLRLELPVSSAPSTSSEWRLRITDVTNGRAGAVIGGGAPIPSYRGNGVRMSDLLLSDMPVEEVASDRPAALPSHEFYIDQPIQIYFELYGLAAGESYRADVVLEPLRSPTLGERIAGLFGRDRSRRISFSRTAGEMSAAASVERVAQTVTAIEPGEYRLTVRIHSSAADSVARSTNLTVYE